MIGQAFHYAKGAGVPSKSRLARWRATAHRVLKESQKFASCSDEELLNQARDARWRAKTGAPLKSLMVEVFAMGVAASRRISPLLRLAKRIPGWAFRIRENPGVGEDRYLRLAG